jgi:hypothetical protein
MEQLRIFVYAQFYPRTTYSEMTPESSLRWGIEQEFATEGDNLAQEKGRCHQGLFLLVEF